MGKQASLVVLRDITERKQAEEALRESQALYFSFIEQLPNPVFRKDREGRYVLVNSEFCKLKGQPREDFIGKKPLEVPPSKFSGPGKDADKMAYERKGEKIHVLILKTGKTFIEEEQYFAADGSEIFKQVMRMPVADSDGNIIGSQGIMFDITERKKTEEELQKSYDLLTKLTNQVPGVVYQYRLYPDGRSAFPISSSGMFDIYEVTSEEVREDASPVFTRLHPEDRDYIVDTINESARNLSHYQSEFRVILPKQGLRWRWCDARPEKLEDGSVLWYGIITDITDRKKTEEQTLKLSKAVTQSPDSIVITDINGNIEYVNPTFTEVTGFTSDEAIGQNPRILKSGEYPIEFYKKLWDTILSGMEWRGEIPNRKKNGELIWENVTISPIVNEKGKITHFVAIMQDITEKKKIYQDLIKAKEEAEESDRLKSAFLANMSHEIRTPMNGILGFTEMLKDPGFEEKEKEEFISIIEKSGNRMLNTINDIIDFSKIEAGQMEVNMSEFSLGSLLNEVYSFFKLEVEQKGLDFSLQTCSSSNSALVYSDSQKLYGVLSNLVKNAVKFTRKGAITIGCQQKDGLFELFVSDTGVGIKKEQMDYIFDRFRQGSESLTRQYEGSGLGLAISKAYVEMLGGTIGVESEHGKGSRFYFTIPGSLKTENVTGAGMEKSGLEPEKPAEKLKILIVEDDPGSELLLTITLKKLTSRILIARNGQDAIEICRKEPEVKVVLMDINMPVMDGLEATKRIREFNKEVVVIAQTAYALAGDREKALAAGCNDYITKPIQKEDLLAMIRQYMEKK
jgi:PAS domain S-box-containing protein